MTPAHDYELEDLEDLFFALQRAAVGDQRLPFGEAARAKYEGERLFGALRSRLKEQTDRIQQLAEDAAEQVIPRKDNE